MVATLLGGCCPPPDVAAPLRPPGWGTAPPIDPERLEPSPLLQMVRDERLAATGPLVAEPASDRAHRGEPHDPAEPDSASRGTPRAAAEDAGTEQGAAEASADAEASTDPETSAEVRRIVVPRRPKLATPEDLWRAKIREVEPRRPRELHVDRLLVRASGPICECDGSREARDEARARVVALVDAARPAIASCLADDLARDPRVLVKAPALLVVSQATRGGPLAFPFAPTLDLGPRGVEVRSLGWPADDPMPEALASCLTAAFEHADVDTTTLTREHRMQVPLVAFSQPAWGFNLGGFHQGLAFQAAALGWQHYERGEPEAALELFRDAYWAYHLDELRYLEGLALERLGRLGAAADAFADYLAARPYAPEAPTLPGRIEGLRARAR